MDCTYPGLILNKDKSRTTRMTKENIALEEKTKERGKSVLSKEEKTEGNIGYLHGCKS